MSVLSVHWKDMLKLKLQYCGHLMWKADSFEKTLMLGKIEGGGEGDDRGWDGWMASLTQWTWVWVDSGSWWWTGRPGVLRFMGLQRVRHDWMAELKWTELNICTVIHLSSCIDYLLEYLFYLSRTLKILGTFDVMPLSFAHRKYGRASTQPMDSTQCFSWLELVQEIKSVISDMHIL